MEISQQFIIRKLYYTYDANGININSHIYIHTHKAATIIFVG